MRFCFLIFCILVSFSKIAAGNPGKTHMVTEGGFTSPADGRTTQAVEHGHLIQEMQEKLHDFKHIGVSDAQQTTLDFSTSTGKKVTLKRVNQKMIQLITHGSTQKSPYIDFKTPIQRVIKVPTSDLIFVQSEDQFALFDLNDGAVSRQKRFHFNTLYKPVLTKRSESDGTSLLVLVSVKGIYTLDFVKSLDQVSLRHLYETNLELETFFDVAEKSEFGSQVYRSSSGANILHLKTIGTDYFIDLSDPSQAETIYDLNWRESLSQIEVTSLFLGPIHYEKVHDSKFKVTLLDQSLINKYLELTHEEYEEVDTSDTEIEFEDDEMQWSDVLGHALEVEPTVEIPSIKTEISFSGELQGSVSYQLGENGEFVLVVRTIDSIYSIDLEKRSLVASYPIQRGIQHPDHLVYYKTSQTSLEVAFEESKEGILYIYNKITVPFLDHALIQKHHYNDLQMPPIRAHEGISTRLFAPKNIQKIIDDYTENKARNLIPFPHPQSSR